MSVSIGSAELSHGWMPNSGAAVGLGNLARPREDQAGRGKFMVQCYGWASSIAEHTIAEFEKALEAVKEEARKKKV